MKIETHCHMLGGSTCAKASAENICSNYIKKGYKGVVLTTHYALSSWEIYPQYTYKEMVDFFFKLVDELKEKGKDMGIKIFYGAEIRIISTKTEYMLYGFTRKFMYDYADLITLSQKDLFDLCNKHNIYMYQTHPFRNGVTYGDHRYMHGAESFNGHFHHENNNMKANEFCEKYNLIKMSGTDYHEVDQPITAGMIVDDNIENEQQLSDFMLSGKGKLITDEKYYREEYNKFKNGFYD